MIPRPLKPKCRYLYRYSSAENINWLEQILLKNQLYLPSPSELNDPFEGKPRPSIVSESSIAQFLYDCYVESHPDSPKSVLDFFKKDIMEQVRRFGRERSLQLMAESVYPLINRHRIYSMSKRWDNTSMWAKYANNHKGYCLEFINSGLFRRASYEVYYTDEDITQDFTNLAKLSANFFYCKKCEWSNEEEVRIVTPLSISNPISFDPKLLSKIILGCKMSQEDRTQIIHWVNERPIPLSVIQATYNEFKHTLELKSI